MYIQLTTSNRGKININLSSEEKQRLKDEIKYYFEEERGENIGIIASENVLDFFLNNLGKYIYNKALDDARNWYEMRIGDLQSDYYAMYK